MKARSIRAGVAACYLGGCFANAVLAASPTLLSVEPPGGQRGTVVDVIFGGERLRDAKGALFYSSGVDLSGFEVVNDKQVKAKLTIASDATLGEYPMRIWTASGVSELRTFYVGPFPTVNEVEPNDSPAHAQPIPLNVTVSGLITAEDVDCFSVQVKKGQRITAEVEGMRLGNTMFDPWLAIMTQDGRVLASCDDTALLLQDPIISILAPEDATYIIKLRDSTYGGNDRCKYRLHVGTFPQPTAILPPGGPAGEKLPVRLLGDVAGPVEQIIPLPALDSRLSQTKRIFAVQNGEFSPAANPIRVSPFPNVLEVEPNNDAAHATNTALALPLGFNGIISEDGDIDFFRFKAGKDETFDFRVYARALRSPLDSVLCIYDGKGKQLASNDDSGGPDSYLRFRIPGDGEYCLSITDQIKRGGPDFTYRVEVTPVQPELVLAMTQPVKDSQEQQTVPVPRGNRYGTLLRAKRSDFDGELVVDSSDLPTGMTMQVAPMPGNSDMVPVVFQAAAEAAIVGKACQFSARPVDTSKKVVSRFEHIVDLVLGDPANTIYYQTSLDKLAVAVTEEAPFRLEIVEPKVPLVQNGTMNLKVLVTREQSFHGPVEVSLLYKPPGTGAENSVKVPADQSEAIIPLSANGDAPVHQWKIAVIGSADAGAGVIRVSSSFKGLEVAQPFVGAKIERGYVEQGQSGTVTCKLTQIKAFEGKAKIQLLNLPNKVTSQEVEITGNDQEIEFPVTADKGSQVGQKKDLFCLLTILKDGEPIVHNIAQGGVLRVGKAAENR